MSENGSIYHNEELLDDLRVIKEDMEKAQKQKRLGLFKSLNKDYNKRMEAKIKAEARGGYDFSGGSSSFDGFGDGCDCGACDND